MFVKPDLSSMRARDQEWAMVHDGWPTGKPGVDAGADRHVLLDYAKNLEESLAQHHREERGYACLTCGLDPRI
jgi:hypothetical protein